MDIKEYKPVVFIVILSFIISPFSFTEVKDIGSYLTDGDVLTKAMENAIVKLFDVSELRSIQCSSFQNLEDVSQVENPFIYKRFEDILVQIFASRGFKIEGGESKLKSKGGEGVVGEDFAGGGGSDIITEESLKESEGMPSSVSGFSLKYRLILAKVDYKKLGGGMLSRIAKVKVHTRIEGKDTGEIYWAGDVEGLYEDVIPGKYLKKLKDTRYVQITTGEEKKKKNPLIEPLLVTGVSAGLILLFTLSARTE
ncbi:MAG: hypothetical protein ACUVWP_02245 [bacterium]